MQCLLECTGWQGGSRGEPGLHLLGGGDGHRLWNQRVRVGTPTLLVTWAVTPLSELDFPVIGGCKR